MSDNYTGPEEYRPREIKQPPRRVNPNNPLIEPFQTVYQPGAPLPEELYKKSSYKQPHTDDYYGTPENYSKKTPGTAITALVVGIISMVFVPLGIVAVIVGHISLKQIKRESREGKGLALAGTILGWISSVILVLALVAVVVLPMLLSQQVTAAMETVKSDVKATVTNIQANPSDPTNPVNVVQSEDNNITVIPAADNNYLVQGENKSLGNKYYYIYSSQTGQYIETSQKELDYYKDNPEKLKQKPAV